MFYLHGVWRSSIWGRYQQKHSVKVLRDHVMVGEGCLYVFKVVVTNILNAEVINNEYKNNGAPFVAPKPWRIGGLVVASIVKARAE